MSGPETVMFALLAVVGGVLLLFGPRSWMLPVFFIITSFAGLPLQVNVAGFNLMLFRVLLICAWLRFLAKGELRTLQWHRLDKAMVAFAGGMILIGILREGGKGLVYETANHLLDGLGTYFLCRILLDEPKAARRLLVCLVVICSGLAVAMVCELVTRRNLLTPLGALVSDVQVREGRARCQATFGHPILAGTFGATLLPVFLACWWYGGRMRKVGIVGCAASTLITYTSGSGGPLMTYAAVLFGCCMWPLRNHLRAIRWSFILVACALHLAMKAPVWALLGRMQVIQGASAFHRYEVLDAFLQNVDKWWLVGVKATEDWGYLTEDVANQYCIVAKHGGILGLGLFIYILVICFGAIGAIRKQQADDPTAEKFLWVFGCILFAHAISFYGISYYDQTRLLWYLCLALVPSLDLFVPSVQTDTVASVHDAEEPEMPGTSAKWA